MEQKKSLGIDVYFATGVKERFEGITFVNTDDADYTIFSRTIMGPEGKDIYDRVAYFKTKLINTIRDYYE